MEDNLKKYGVYMIRNVINGKVYIGSTRDTFKNRWRTHKRLLKCNKYCNKHLQSSYNKYGVDKFEYQIVEITDPVKALTREGYYIKLYKSTNPNYGYNQAEVDENGKTNLSDETKRKLSKAIKQLWKEGVYNPANFKGKSPWNKGLKCNNISLTRRNMFNVVEVYKDNILIATFRSVIDLSEWTKTNELPGLTYYHDKYDRPNLGKRTTYLQSQNIHRAVRNKSIYRGLSFKKTLPLSPEMGIVKWENCWNGENPNQQPSQPLTKLEGSETNS